MSLLGVFGEREQGGDVRSNNGNENIKGSDGCSSSFEYCKIFFGTSRIR